MATGNDGFFGNPDEVQVDSGIEIIAKRAYIALLGCADTFNRLIFIPLVDIIALPDVAVKHIFQVNDNDLLALQASFPGGYDDIVILSVIKLGKAPKAVRKLLKPSDIKYTQPTASPNFSKGGHTINSTIKDIKTGRIDPNDAIPTIRVVNYEGKYRSLDNRRVVTFKHSGVEEISVLEESLKNPEIRKEFQRKFNPIDDGDWIVVTPAKGRKAAEQVLKEYGKIK